MGLLNGLMGNAAEYSTDEIQKELGPILTDNENIEKAFKILRDGLIYY